MARPDLNLPFTLQTDASNRQLGAVLSQEFANGEHPITFASRSLTKAERNYTVTEKECLAVLWAVEKFRCYLLGEEFTVITDHSSLLWHHNLKDPTGRLARWATALHAYNIKIVHRKGALHKVPDALSRAFNEEVDEIAVIGVVDPDGWYSRHFDAVEKEPFKYPDWKIENNRVVDPDGWYSRHFDAVEKEPFKYPDWKIENNLLYKHCPNRFVDETVADLDRWKLVIPEVDRERVLFEYHNPPHAGHLGAEKTRFRVAQTYF